MTDEMNILKTFELFLSQPLSIIRDNIFQIYHVESNGLSPVNKIQFNLSAEATQINVYNSPKVYNLLTSVLYKKKKLDDSKKREIRNQRRKSLPMS